MNQDYAGRIDALRALLNDDVRAVALVPGANMIYFTGLQFHLSERPTIALFSADGLSIIVPRLEMQKLAERPDLNARAFAWGDEEGFSGAFAAAVEALGLRGKAVGVDGMTMRYSEWLMFHAADSTLRAVPVERELTRIRSRKRPDEVEAMRRAVRISEEALQAVLGEIKPGMTERQIGALLDALMQSMGAQGLAFESLVQSGPNSANPHGHATDRVVREGEFLLIDFGCKVGGYPADITRTFCMGEPSDEMRRIFDTVARANEAARAAARPGVAMGDVDKAARAVIEEAGYGQYFTHRTGHGLGLDPHEPIPQIAANVTDLLEPGMTFTIEPGIYVPGLGGVRIEDNVFVTEDGLDVLTRFPRQLSF